ncbi:RusA family crossover junction endodeoxyribonuclease [Lysobacter capsici]|uniref:RusA family crossover junction endodeoxyribonuclease n=1 Tax=Lysobacter capsici TaxID=435897 RepID=UPI0013659F8C|nr:RusA family crossover junction endodeoxyribonuclease [Lysobacter capsici]
MTPKKAAAITDSPAGETQLCVSLVFPIEPLPASRPRVTKWGTYIAKPYKGWLAEAAKYLKTVNAVVPEGPLVVVVEVVCTKARTSKLVTPKGDIDNYLKAPLDAITHAKLWEDDKWVTTVIASKRFAATGESAHTSVRIYATAQQTVFARVCEFIGALFR